jgi:zinc protease
MNQLAAGIQEIVTFGLPDDYFETFPGKVRALGREDIGAAAEKVLRPDRLVWVVVGDREKIEEGIQKLDFGPVSYLDADGNPLAQ